MIIKNNVPKIFCILGPTGIGKSYIAMELCKILPLEIISVDSGLIYRDLNIGTAKPSNLELKYFPHRLVNIINPNEFYSVKKFFINLIYELNDIIYIKKKIPLLVGGTMMYYNVLFNGLYLLPKSNYKIRSYINNLFYKFGNNYVYNILKKIDFYSYQNIHINDRYRIMRNLEVFYMTQKNISYFKNINKLNLNFKIYKIFFIPKDKNKLFKIVINRFYNMLSKGFEDEVLNLYIRGDLDINKPSIKCIGYKQMWLYIDKKISYLKMIEETISSTLNLIKRQLTWLKKWSSNFTIICDNNYEQKISKIFNFIIKLIN